MTAPNHIAGGFTITGIISSLMNINILQDYKLLGAVVIGSLFADIDTTKSVIGRLFYPISKYINTHYGHRTITHSLVFLIGLLVFLTALQRSFFGDVMLIYVFGIAYASHLLLDMMTIQGVPLFYPLKRNACVIPGNPELRFRTSSIRHETLAFCIFMCAAIYLKPLFDNGFWTSYNSLFGTTKHLYSEFRKSPDLMHLTISIQEGSDHDIIEGLCVAAEKDEFVIIDKSKRFHSYPKKGMILKDIYPRHTKMAFSFRDFTFVNITIDSINSLFEKGHFSRIEIQGSKAFNVIENGITTAQDKLELDYPNHLQLAKIPTVIRTPKPFTPNPQIGHGLEDIQKLKATHEQDFQSYITDLESYNKKKIALMTEQDPVKKELMMIKFSKLKPPKAPRDIQSNLDKINTRIDKLKRQDATKRANRPTPQLNIPLTFSGTFTELLINGKSL